MRRVGATTAAIFLIAAACSGGGAGSTDTGPAGPSGPTGGHATTIVASGSTMPTYFFSPVPDTVAVGTAVTFRFLDVTHTVTFNQAIGVPADIPATSHADSTRVFLTPGSYSYSCSIHQYMQGTVVVQ